MSKQTNHNSNDTLDPTKTKPEVRELNEVELDSISGGVMKNRTRK
ncbi:MAG: hypothetical protein ACRC2R_14845 [Xenococcaceae cyanobacterium]